VSGVPRRRFPHERPEFPVRLRRIVEYGDKGIEAVAGEREKPLIEKNVDRDLSGATNWARVFPVAAAARSIRSRMRAGSRTFTTASRWSLSPPNGPALAFEAIKSTRAAHFT
jgi:hypothetical protein